MNKQQIKDFMAARHPDMRFNKNADSWVKPGSGYGMTAQEAEAEAKAEVEMWQDGVSKKPAWLKS